MKAYTGWMADLFPVSFVIKKEGIDMRNWGILGTILVILLIIYLFQRVF